jgi:hypothetical protein
MTAPIHIPWVEPPRTDAANMIARTGKTQGETTTRTTCALTRMESERSASPGVSSTSRGLLQRERVRIQTRKWMIDADARSHSEAAAADEFGLVQGHRGARRSAPSPPRRPWSGRGCGAQRRWPSRRTRPARSSRSAAPHSEQASLKCVATSGFPAPKTGDVRAHRSGVSPLAPAGSSGDSPKVQPPSATFGQRQRRGAYFSPAVERERSG